MVYFLFCINFLMTLSITACTAASAKLNLFFGPRSTWEGLVRQTRISPLRTGLRPHLGGSQGRGLPLLLRLARMTALALASAP
jgi:hypothetical protein